MDKRMCLGSEWVRVYEFGFVVSGHAELHTNCRMT